MFLEKISFEFYKKQYYVFVNYGILLNQCLEVGSHLKWSFWIIYIRNACVELTSAKENESRADDADGHEKGGLGWFNEGSKKGGDVSIADASRGIHVARCSWRSVHTEPTINRECPSTFCVKGIPPLDSLDSSSHISYFFRLSLFHLPVRTVW